MTRFYVRKRTSILFMVSNGIYLLIHAPHVSVDVRLFYLWYPMVSIHFDSRAPNVSVRKSAGLFKGYQISTTSFMYDIDSDACFQYLLLLCIIISTSFFQYDTFNKIIEVSSND
jgi:hypothetical protein